MEIKKNHYPFESNWILVTAAWTVTIFYVHTEKANTKEGYIPRVRIGDGIYAGDAVVRNYESKAYLNFANTNETTVTVSILKIKLKDLKN